MRASTKTSLAILAASLFLLTLDLGCSGDNPTSPDATTAANGIDFVAKGGRSENMIDNPGFEAGFWHWEYLTGDNWIISEQNPHGGDKCAQYVAPGGYGWVNTQLWTADYGCIWFGGNSPRYRFSYWARMERPDGAPSGVVPTAVWVRIFVNDNEYFTLPIELTESWRQLSQELYISESGCGWILVQVVGEATNSTLIVALDDFELRTF